MGERTYAARAASRNTSAATKLGRRARRWTDVGATATSEPPSSAGPTHDLAHISVSAPRPTATPADAPIQRVRWTWDAANQKWSGPPGAAAHQPVHKGTVDGESYEDTKRRNLFASG